MKIFSKQRRERDLLPLYTVSWASAQALANTIILFLKNLELAITIHLSTYFGPPYYFRSVPELL